MTCSSLMLEGIVVFIDRGMIILINIIRGYGYLGSFTRAAGLSSLMYRGMVYAWFMFGALLPNVVDIFFIVEKCPWPRKQCIRYVNPCLIREPLSIRDPSLWPGGKQHLKSILGCPCV